MHVEHYCKAMQAQLANYLSSIVLMKAIMKNLQDGMHQA